MKKTLVLACTTLKPELQNAIEAVGCEYPVRWLESGLHNVPKILNKALQEQVDQADADGFEKILFSFGFCGNSFTGLNTRRCECIIPRVDDCISLLLGSVKNRQELQQAAGTYFMTKGWIDGERNIMVEYNYTMEKYGEELGEEIFEMMFGHYKRIGILDTQCYEMSDVIKEAEQMAQVLHLGCEVFPASNDYLKALLTGPWTGEKFLILPPQTTIQAEELRFF